MVFKNISPGCGARASLMLFFVGSKIKQQLETYTRPEQSESIPQGGIIQNGDTENHRDLPPTRGVGYLNRPQECLLPHSNTRTVQDISEISHPGSVISVQGTAIRTVHSPHGVYCNSKGGEADGFRQGKRIHQYLYDWLVRNLSHQVCLQHTQELVQIFRKLGWLVNMEKSELDPKQVFDFVGYQFDLKCGLSPQRTGLSSTAAHVFDRSANSHGKISLPQLTTYETHTVASQKQLEDSRITRKGDPYPQVSVPPSKMVAAERQYASRSTIIPNKSCSENLSSKEKWGTH